MEAGINAVRLSKREIRALTAAASRDKDRSHLANVVVDPGRYPARAWTTDGARLVMVEAPDEGDRGAAYGRRYTEAGVPLARSEPALVPTGVLDQAAKLVPTQGHVVVRFGPACRPTAADATTLAWPSNHAVVEVLDELDQPVATLSTRLADATPPPVDQVLPRRHAEQVAEGFGIQAKLLSQVKLIADACGGSGGIVVWAPADPMSPVAFRAEATDGSRWTCVVMPFRLELEPLAMPGGYSAPADGAGQHDALPEAKPAKRRRSRRKSA